MATQRGREGGGGAAAALAQPSWAAASQGSAHRPFRLDVVVRSVFNRSATGLGIKNSMGIVGSRTVGLAVRFNAGFNQAPLPAARTFLYVHVHPRAPTPRHPSSAIQAEGESSPPTDAPFPSAAPVPRKDSRVPFALIRRISIQKSPCPSSPRYSSLVLGCATAESKHFLVAAKVPHHTMVASLVWSRALRV